jgi:hypothetical protein
MTAPLGKSARENAPRALQNDKSAHRLYIWLATQADASPKVMLTPAEIVRRYQAHQHTNSQRIQSSQRINVLLRRLRGGIADDWVFTGLVAPEHEEAGRTDVAERVAFIVPLDARGREITGLNPDAKPRKGRIRGFAIRRPKLPTTYRRVLRNGTEVPRTTSRYAAVVRSRPTAQAVADALARAQHPDPVSVSPGLIRPSGGPSARSDEPVPERAKEDKDFRQTPSCAPRSLDGQPGPQIRKPEGLEGPSGADAPHAPRSGSQATPLCPSSGNPPELGRCPSPPQAAADAPKDSAGRGAPASNPEQAKGSVARDSAGRGAAANATGQTARGAAAPGTGQQARSARRPPESGTPRPLAADPAVQASIDAANAALTKNRWPKTRPGRARLFFGGDARGVTDPADAALPRLIGGLVDTGHDIEHLIVALGVLLRGRADRCQGGRARPEPVTPAELTAAVAVAAARGGAAGDAGVQKYRLDSAYGQQRRDRAAAEARLTAAAALAWSAPEGDEPF